MGLVINLGPTLITKVQKPVKQVCLPYSQQHGLSGFILNLFAFG